MPTYKPRARPTPTVSVNIVTAKGTPAMRQAWARFWRAVAVQAKAQASEAMK